jgi:uncharacterized protein YcaQ
MPRYKPAAQRRWGYFALPTLYGDRLVGKLDATADRKAGVLRVHGSKIRQLTDVSHCNLQQHLSCNRR